LRLKNDQEAFLSRAFRLVEFLLQISEGRIEEVLIRIAVGLSEGRLAPNDTQRYEKRREPKADA